MTNRLQNSTVVQHPHGYIEIEVYDSHGERLEVSNVYQAFESIVVTLKEVK